MKTHYHQIVANGVMRSTLIHLRKHLRSSLQAQKDVIRYNLTALDFVKRKNDSERITQFYDEEGLDEEKIKSKIAEGKKRKRVNLKS